MPIHRLTHFSDPIALQTIAPATLSALLRPYAVPLRAAGVALPLTETPDYERLAELFVTAPEEVPEELIEALFYIDGLATPDGLDGLLQAFPDINPPWHAWTPVDVAAQAWLLDRDRFEQVFAERQVSRRNRKFVAYAAREPDLRGCELSPAAKEQLERELEAQFTARGRGGGTRIFSSERTDGIWFLIRHGAPLRREACLREGRSASVLFRPERYDAVVFSPTRGELRINAASRWQKELYRRLFGMHLFGDPEFFPTDDRYTLTPLLSDGPASLACADVPAIASIRLTHLEYIEPGPTTLGTARWAEDLFALISAGRWAIPTCARLTRAKFLIRLVGSRTARTVTVAPPNEVKYSLESDGVPVEQWLENRGFVVTGWEEGDDDETDFEPILAFPGTSDGAGGGVRRVATLFGT